MMNIKIAFGINDEYSQHVGVTIASILKNASEKDDYTIIIFTDKISPKNQAKLEKLKEIKDFELVFIKVNKRELKRHGFTSYLLGLSTFYRLELLKHPELGKVIYLDSDVVVRADIAELYKTNVNHKYGAAVRDIISDVMIKRWNLPEDGFYFNAGVILFNLKLCSKDNLLDKILNILETTESKVPPNDQDFLNIAMHEKIVELDLKWNVCYPYLNEYKDKAYYHEVGKNPAILHYITDAKPWRCDKNPHMKGEYFKYLEFTPWYYDFMEEYIDRQNEYMAQRFDNEYYKKKYDKQVVEYKSLMKEYNILKKNYRAVVRELKALKKSM